MDRLIENISPLFSSMNGRRKLNKIHNNMTYDDAIVQRTSSKTTTMNKCNDESDNASDRSNRSDELIISDEKYCKDSEHINNSRNDVIQTTSNNFDNGFDDEFNNESDDGFDDDFVDYENYSDDHHNAQYENEEQYQNASRVEYCITHHDTHCNDTHCNDTHCNEDHDPEYYPDYEDNMMTNNYEDMNDVIDVDNIGLDMYREMIEHQNHNDQDILMEKIKKYIHNPSDELKISKIIISSLPKILSTLTEVIYLKLYNCELKNLENMPPNVELLNISKNKLRMIDNNMIPLNVKELDASKNNISHLDLRNLKQLISIDLSKNPLTDYIFFPENIREIVISDANITSLKPFQNLISLKTLKISSSNVGSIDLLPDDIQYLTLNNCDFSKSNGMIFKVPRNIIKLIIKSSRIQSFNFEKFPVGLQVLDVSDNLFTTLPQFPDGMTLLVCKNSYLASIKNIPQSIKSITIHSMCDFHLTPVQKIVFDEQIAVHMIDVDIQTNVIVDEKNKSNDYNEKNHMKGFNGSYNFVDSNYQSNDSKYHLSSFNKKNTQRSESRRLINPLLFAEASNWTNYNYADYGNQAKQNDHENMHIDIRHQRREIIPSYIKKLMSGDTFMSNKSRKIEHRNAYIY